MEEKLKLLLETIVKISDTDEVLGEILLTNFQNSIDIYESINSGTELDVSEKLNLICKLTKINLIEVIKLLNSENSIDTENAEKESIDFIMNNTDIDEYKEFLKETKENINYLKTELKG